MIPGLPNLLLCFVFNHFCVGNTCMIDAKQWYSINLVSSVVSDPRLYIIAGIESNYDLDAKSHADAVGLFQITPIAQKHMNKLHKLELDRNIPSDNVLLGKLYWAWLATQYNNDTRKMLIGYNAGGTWANKTNDQLPRETRDYITRFNERAEKCGIK